MPTMNPPKLTAAAVLALALLAPLVSCVSLERAGRAEATDVSETRVLTGSGLGLHPASTATDWVTYADHVVVVIATDEEALPPTNSERDRGEDLTMRKVGFTVSEVVWSSPTAKQAAPDALRFGAFGWIYKAGQDPYVVEAADGAAPRFEVGHRYLLALTWEEARCSAGDEPQPARWEFLGPEAAIAFDDGVIGNGEFSGTVRRVPAGAVEAATVARSDSFRDALSGGTLDVLREALAAVSPAERQSRRKPAPCPAP